ncbi:putative quinol monooxygenase [Brachybacterium sp. GCM10030267]|uniref:putative quinol monooxygenase n=1 Tax=Brachybacterium sp. GCM10030267 TaxID=3273381 RepID=UPI00361C230E
MTRAEEGCEYFDVTRTDDPLIWSVQEQFRDADAFAAHQERVKDDAWGRATATIKRDYEVTGLPTETAE